MFQRRHSIETATLASLALVSDILAILAGISWTMSTIVAKKLRQKANLDLLSLTTWQMLFGTIQNLQQSR